MKRASTAVLLLLAGVTIFSPQCLAADQDDVAANTGGDPNIQASPDAAAGATDSTSKEEWSFGTLKEDVIEFARNALCGPAAPEGEVTFRQSQLPRCGRGCRFRVVRGRRSFNGRCRARGQVFSCGRGRRFFVSDDGAPATPPADSKDSLAKAKNLFEEKLADFVEWTGLCEDDADADGFITVDGDYTVDYDSVQSESYDDYYGETPPATEDATPPPAEDATETKSEL